MSYYMPLSSRAVAARKHAAFFNRLSRKFPGQDQFYLVAMASAEAKRRELCAALMSGCRAIFSDLIDAKEAYDEISASGGRYGFADPDHLDLVASARSNIARLSLELGIEPDTLRVNPSDDIPF